MFPEARADEGELGRYVVVGEAGAGGMGVVLRAYDPTLRREVALKRLQRNADGTAPASLLAEARAMARLSHPNVVTVFDLVEFEGRNYIVMEYVEGQTLREWFAAGPRAWREVVAVMIDAAHGLAAAHAAGIVHRDFKPANVLLGGDGRPRVMDFGLASAAREPETAASASHDDAWIVGTPAYMAPEQQASAAADARADQYAWCVVLYEGLYGERPFAGRSLEALAEAKRAGLPRLPRRPAIPRWLATVLRRGLAPVPQQRFASLPALLSTIERGRRRARMGTAALALAGLGTVGLGLLARERLDERRRAQACDALAAAVTSVWAPPGAAARVALERALTGATDDAAVASRFSARADAWAQQWSEARAASCRAATVEHRWDDALRSRADECLDESSTVMSALLHELERGERHTAMRAIQAVASMPPPQGCADPEQLLRRPPLAATDREGVHAIRAQLWHAHAAVLAGRHDDAIGLAAAALASARARDDTELVAEAEVMLGRAYSRAADFPAAHDALVEGYLAAGRSGAQAVALAAATQLAFVVGVRLGRGDDGRFWGRLAEVELARLGGGAELDRAALAMNLAGIDYQLGALDDARARYEQALEIRTRVLGEIHPDTAALQLSLGNVAMARGDAVGADRSYGRAREVFEATLGPEHPDVARALGNLANARAQLGDDRGAEAMQRRALAISLRQQGPAHADVALSHAGLGKIFHGRGEFERAIAEHAIALELALRAYGPDHPNVAIHLDNLAAGYGRAGEPARALPLHRRAVEIFTAALGPEHTETIRALQNVAHCELALGHPAAAESLYARVLATTAARPGVDPIVIAGMVTDMAEATAAASREAATADHRRERRGHASSDSSTTTAPPPSRP